ncbi:ABC transporter ATP-binding protein [Pseudonocardia sp. C8]|uniref:ABC transporter ATP-binding protein n=1 Tax=Pseudonocardia sp. C8 TaxID=2762759 RepID=UPI0016426378|nr:ATP-binding cassette domain-containing protein [Pseudonocardia sp. C8]MBC3192326.1 ABC transporter ATP-binding protein [Pseudonocardia sp. C8]
MKPDTSGGPPLLSIRDLTVSIGGRELVRSVHLDVDRGERVALLGPSGSGKSLTAAAVLGRLPAVATGSGTVALAGRDVLAVPAARRPRRVRVAAVGQDSRVALNPLVPVGVQLRAAVRAAGTGDTTDLAAELAATGLADPERILGGLPGELSGGQRQRVQLALALACRPDLLVADEPTTALDPVTRSRVLDVLADRLADSSTALLFISHDVPAADRLCTRSVHLDGGRVVPATEPGSPGRAAVELGPPGHATAEPGPPGRAAEPSPPGRATAELGPSGCASAEPGHAAAEPFLAARDLHRVHPDPRPRRPWRRPADPVRALRGVDLDLAPGERVGLAGPSGAGKSSLLRILLGLDRPDQGTVTVEGREIGAAGARRWFRRAVQYVPQDPAGSLNPRWTIQDLVAEPLRRLAVPGDHAEAVRTALDRVGLTAGLADRRPGELSGGQAQRAALARALVVRPRLLLADEPVSGLDPQLREQVVELLADTCAATGAGLLLVAHDLDVAEALCSRLVVLDAGRVVEDGPTTEVLARPTHPTTAGLVRAAGTRVPA